MTIPARDWDSRDDRVDLGELMGSIGFLLRLAQLRAFERFFGELGGHGLRPGEFSALWVVRRNPGIRQGLLARTLRIKPAHMTKMIRRLEDSGRIRREVPDEDRRAVSLFLTQAGTAFVTDHADAFLGQDDARHHGLSAAEADDLTRLLRRYAGLDAEDDR